MSPVKHHVLLERDAIEIPDGPNEVSDLKCANESVDDVDDADDVEDEF